MSTVNSLSKCGVAYAAMSIKDEVRVCRFTKVVGAIGQPLNILSSGSPQRCRRPSHEERTKVPARPCKAQQVHRHHMTHDLYAQVTFRTGIYQCDTATHFHKYV